jgi:CheY-like chemotaxis protein
MVSSILLIEDDEATNYLNQIIIHQFNCFKSIHISYNAQDAINYLTAKGEYKEYKGIKLPEIILLDINLPGMDGWEFLDHYSNLNLCALNNTIVTILTVSPRETSLSKIRGYDCLNDYLEKPLTFEKLDQVIKIVTANKKR